MLKKPSHFTLNLVLKSLKMLDTKCKHFIAWSISNSQMRQLDGLANNSSELRGTTTFTKVVTQFIQFLSDSQTATELDKQVKSIMFDCL